MEPDWTQIRNTAAISMMNALLETTKHSVVESLAIKDIYAVTAVLYADALVDALKLDKDQLKHKLNIFKKNKS